MHRIRKILVFLCLATFLALGAVSGVLASPVQVPEKIKAVMIGDRLVDVSLKLGVLPEGMSVRCSMWPKCKQIVLASQVLGCPNCVITKNPKALIGFMKKHGITRLILEKSEPFCLYTGVNPVQAADLVKDMPGVQVEYVDFTKGVASAIEQTAQLLGKEARGREVAAAYAGEMKKVEELLPAEKTGRRVLVLNGVYAAATGKTFVRVEAPGGYTDQYILDPLGCVNAADVLVGDGTGISKGHVSAGRLGGLAKARPDVIVMTGDAFAVQAALHEAVLKNPALGGIPALKNTAVYSLPFYGDSSILEYPQIFRQWAKALLN